MSLWLENEYPGKLRAVVSLGGKFRLRRYEIGYEKFKGYDTRGEVRLIMISPFQFNFQEVDEYSEHTTSHSKDRTKKIFFFLLRDDK